MKTLFKFLLTALAAMLLLTLNGCAGDAAAGEATDVAVIWGANNCSRQIKLDEKTLMDAIMSVCRSGGTISTVIPQGGEPKLLINRKEIPLPDTRLSKEILEYDARNYAAEILETLAGPESFPDREEKDLLQAMSLCGRLLSSDNGNQKILLITGTVISTDGLLNYTTGNLLSRAPEEIVDQLKMAEALPDLKGVTVYWLYPLDCHPPQPQPTEKQGNQLLGQWRAVLAACGAKEVNFVMDAIPEQGGYEGPHVSVMQVDTTPQLIFPEPVTLMCETLGFKGDSAAFRSPDAVHMALTPIAEAMAAHPSQTVLLVGTTASGDLQKGMDLSLARAEAVRQALLELGIRPDQIISVGLAHNNPWHEEDRDSYGRIVEAVARRNRAVHVLDIQSEEAQVLLREYTIFSHEQNSKNAVKSKDFGHG